VVGKTGCLLGNAPIGVDHLMRDVPRPIALNRHKVLHGAATRDPVHRVKVLGQAADSRWRDPSLTAWWDLWEGVSFKDRSHND